jgi:hypothetical protein
LHHQKGDTSFFFLRNKQVMIFVLVYVDDIIVPSSSQEATNALVKNLEKKNRSQGPWGPSLFFRHRGHED